ncbi:MAG TPA: trypsin-like peptidase domain-containing protein [Oscillospiraceae bacterium]|nr:trypsin-like peptidase domain-containing protein [Oscillospiraceae bacterium]
MFDNYNKNEKVTEVTYYPVEEDLNASRKKKIKTVSKVIGALLCCAAISAASIGGYITATGGNFPNGAISQSSDSDSTAKKVTDNSKSLIELSSKQNALTVPNIVKKVTPSVVGVSSTMPEGTQTGTGIIMTKEGYIITNCHVVSGSSQVSVVLSDKKEYGALVVGTDSKTDLAVLKIQADETLTPAEFGSSDDLVVGELAIAIGNPLGLEFSGSVTSGIISALNREVTIEDKEFTLIQTDAAINPGNSGGPLVNSYGQVIGITSAKISTSYAEGMGFAIPINSAVDIVDELIKNGYVTGRPLIGLSGEDIDEMMSKFYNIPQGVYVRIVNSDSPAEKAGIRVGDVIIGANGKEITSMDELNKIKEEFKPGDSIKLTVYREGQKLELSLTLSEATS